MVHDEVGDHPDAALVRRVEQRHEVVDRAELGQHLVEVADVVAAVAQRRVVERRQPEAVDAEPLQVVQPLDQAAQIARPVRAGVVEGPDEDLVEHGPLEPGGVGGQHTRVAEVLGGGMLDHTVLDMAAPGRVVPVHQVHRVHRVPHLPTRRYLNHCRCSTKTCAGSTYGSIRTALCWPHSYVAPGFWSVTVNRSCQSMPSSGMFSVVFPHCTLLPSKDTTTRTVLPVSGSRLEKHSSAPLSTSWKRRLRSQCRAGLPARIRLSRVMYGASDRPVRSASAQFRGFSSYFSLSMYSSEPGRATCSNSS